jgi:hypothetical protein
MFLLARPENGVLRTQGPFNGFIRRSCPNQMSAPLLCGGSLQLCRLEASFGVLSFIGFFQEF